MTRRKGALSLLVTLTMLAAMFLVAPSAAEAQSNPYERGPDPTASSLEGSGPYSVSTSGVSGWGIGFGGGTVYYPTGTSDTFGGIAISPGFTASSSSMAWYGRRMASHGFVAIVIDTNSSFDQPNSRATQLLNALEWLEDDSPSAVRARLDPSRMAVAGHSMGGGGSLRASTSDQTLKASIPLTGWHTTKTFGTSVPQLIVGAENDSVASVNSHSIPFYNNLPSSTPKMYVELAGASHFAPNSSDDDISRMSVAWLKRWVDNDSRYNTFLCGAEAPTSGGWGSDLSDVRDNCSQGWGEGGGDPGDPGDPDPVCVTASNSAHVDANRAVQYWWTVYARGTGDNLGYSWNTSSLLQTGTNEWTEVSSC